MMIIECHIHGMVEFEGDTDLGGDMITMYCPKCVAESQDETYPEPIAKPQDETKLKRFRLRDIYLSYVDTVVEARDKEEAQKILERIPHYDLGQLDDNKMFQGEELEEVDDSIDLTTLTKADKQDITDDLGYQIYEGITPSK